MAAAMPFWFTLLSMVIFAFYFSLFIEAAIVAVIMDSIYGRPFFHLSFIITLVAVGIIFLAERVKKELFVY